MKLPTLMLSALILVLTVGFFSCKSGETPTSEAYEVPEEIKALPEGITLGLRAPEIVLPDTAGEVKKLSDLQGKLVLVDFWAAWCNPCRRENPELVKVYSEYKDKVFSKGSGFEILSVSLDRNREAWIEAMETDKINWPYALGDMQGARTPPAMDYEIQMIPANFLLDQNGVVIASNLRGASLEEKLKELLSE